MAFKKLGEHAFCCLFGKKCSFKTTFVLQGSAKLDLFPHLLIRGLKIQKAPSPSGEGWDEDFKINWLQHVLALSATVPALPYYLHPM